MAKLARTHRELKWILRQNATRYVYKTVCIQDYYSGHQSAHIYVVLRTVFIYIHLRQTSQKNMKHVSQKPNSSAYWSIFRQNHACCHMMIITPHAFYDYQSLHPLLPCVYFSEMIHSCFITEAAKNQLHKQYFFFLSTRWASTGSVLHRCHKTLRLGLLMWLTKLKRFLNSKARKKGELAMEMSTVPNIRQQSNSNSKLCYHR